MIKIFLATMNPMLTLFICMLVGFILRKAEILPANSSKTMSKLVVWVFYPALSFCTMARNFTVDTLKTHASNILMFLVGLACAITISMYQK